MPAHGKQSYAVKIVCDDCTHEQIFDTSAFSVFCLFRFFQLHKSFFDFRLKVEIIRDAKFFERCAEENLEACFLHNVRRLSSWMTTPFR